MTPRRRDRVLRALARRLTVNPLVQRVVSRPTNARGDVLDASVAVMLALDARVAGSLDPSPSVARKRADMTRGSWLAAGDPPPVPTEDVLLGALRARVYRPAGARAGLVFLHGGGWCVGDLGSHDVLCRRLAVQADRVVLAVDYPLAPEHPWPAPVHACAAAWRDAVAMLGGEGIPAGRIALGGDSAGGNLSAAVCRLMRDGGPMPALQLLIYPALDATRSGASHREFAEGFLLTEASIVWYLDRYAPAALDPMASPVLADDLEGLPPAVVTVAGFDPLRDEGLLYAERLRRAGVPVTLLDEGPLVHGYANLDGLVPEASRAIDRIAEAIGPDRCS